MEYLRKNHTNVVDVETLQRNDGIFEEKLKELEESLPVKEVQE